MKPYLLGLLLSISIPFQGMAQEMPVLTKKDSIVVSSWMVGVGFNVVDDSGDVFDELFSVSSQWNAVPYPSRISIGRYFKSGLGLEAIGSYNQYGVGNIIDGQINTATTDYFAIDTRLSYDVNKLIGETAWFDPYVGIGLGYTDANNQPRPTYNAVLGFRTWISDHWGLDFNTSGKWDAGNGEATNHLQHAAGVVYRFGIEKELSKKGLDKLAMIEALEREKQRVADSVATERQKREEAALAQRLEQERREAEVAAAEKERLEAEQRRRNEIDDKIKALGTPHYPLNSSYLTANGKDILDGLVGILEEAPTLTIELSGHADSRGAAQYNAWLSERRAARAKDYLIQAGIDADRIRTIGFGEEQLLNECDDHTVCPEEKHRVNRRSEFKVLTY